MAVLRLIIVREHSQLPPEMFKKDGSDSSEAVVARRFCNVLFLGACRFSEPVYSGFDSLESIIDGNLWFTIRAQSPRFVGAIFFMRTKFTTPRTCLNFDDLSIGFI